MGKKKSGNNVTKLSFNDTTQDDENVTNLKYTPKEIIFKNESQQEYWNLMNNKEITICAGPAGTGKSFLSAAKALDLHTKERSKYKNIIIVTPAVEADEKLGALPGTMEEKLEPYNFSTIYTFEKLIGKVKTETLMKRGRIKQMGLGFMRGVTIDNAVVIFEEMQNSTPKQMKTILTRIGENAKYFITGDLEQSDRYQKYEDCGLYVAMEKLKDVVQIGVFQFEQKDIVRNPIISIILEKFNGSIK